jgi:hypothetical protein
MSVFIFYTTVEVITTPFLTLLFVERQTVSFDDRPSMHRSVKGLENRLYRKNVNTPIMIVTSLSS